MHLFRKVANLQQKLEECKKKTEQFRQAISRSPLSPTFSQRIFELYSYHHHVDTSVHTRSLSPRICHRYTIIAKQVFRTELKVVALHRQCKGPSGKEESTTAKSACDMTNQEGANECTETLTSDFLSALFAHLSVQLSSEYEIAIKDTNSVTLFPYLLERWEALL